MSENFWGYHLSLDCSGCNHESITNKSTIEKFSKTLVDRIDMIAYGEPQIINFGSGNKEGYTLIQLIETSNICAHFVNETDDVYLDVFSCKSYDPEVVKNTLREYFNAKSIKEHYFTRQA